MRACDEAALIGVDGELDVDLILRRLSECNQQMST